jgi:uncharacterized membrane protein
MRNSFRFGVPVVAAFVAVATASPASAAVVVTGMAALPGETTSQATSVRDDGVVVGFVWGSTYGDRAVLWQASGEITELATPGRNSRANDINAAGVVVGEAEPAGIERPYPAWWDMTGALTELPGDFSGYARAVNDAGVVVGVSDVDGQSPLRWENPSTPATALPTLAGGANDAVPYDVNNDGVVVGYSRGPDGIRHAVRWAAAGGVSALETPAGYVSCFASSINDAGFVVGACGTATVGVSAAVRWDTTGGATVLPAFGTSYAEAVGISEAGLIVGTALDTAGRYTAVRWGAFGTVTRLATLGGPHGVAYGINDTGTIVGRTMVADNSFHATSWRNAG